MGSSPIHGLRIYVFEVKCSCPRTFGLFTKILLQNFTLIVICNVRVSFFFVQTMSGFGLNIALASFKKKS